jgi:hypothetical protein
MFIAAAQEEALSSSQGPLSVPEAVDTRPQQEDDGDNSVPTIQVVLEEARTRIAHIAGVPTATVRLKLKIDS